MFETFLSSLNQEKRNEGFFDWFEQRHPLLGMLVFQIAAGVILIGAVGGIAFTGGMIIWMFYQVIGVM